MDAEASVASGWHKNYVMARKPTQSEVGRRQVVGRDWWDDSKEISIHINNRIDV